MIDGAARPSSRRPWRSQLTGQAPRGREPASRGVDLPGAGDGTASDAIIDVVHKVIDERRVHTVFQPLVHLATAEVVGYEALTRGPLRSLVETPLELLRAARAAGRLAELDWLCAATACDAALAANLHPSMSIFLNFEPSTLLSPRPKDLEKSTRRAEDRLRIVIEMREDTMMADPGRFFDALDQARKIGWGVAIDNAGVSAESLALLPLSHPDVLKLDLRELSRDLTTLAEMGDGARLYAEQTGATVLAYGLEASDDVPLARAMGATFGQGFTLGRPALLPAGRAVPRSVVPLLVPVPTNVGGATPFEIINRQLPAAVTQKRFLRPLSTYMEDRIGPGSPGLLLISHQLGIVIGDRQRARLRDLAHRSSYMVAFGPGLDAVDWPRSRTGTLDADDRFANEWTVIVLTPTYAGAMVARDLGQRGADAYREFEYVITHDRDLILQAAYALLARVKPAQSVP